MLYFPVGKASTKKRTLSYAGPQDESPRVESSTTLVKPDFLHKPVVHILLIAILGLIVYSNSFRVPFQFDDLPNIKDNPIIKDFQYFVEPSSAKALPLYDDLKSRFIGHLTFALNCKMHGLNVTGYHIVNLLIHIINALLVYWIVILTFRTPALKPSHNNYQRFADLIALFSALLFVSHPVQTQAVTYIVQRFASPATLFYLLSIASYIRSRLSTERHTRFIFYIISFISAFLAMKTKEIAFTLPVMITIYEIMFFEGKLTKRILYLIPLLLTMAIIPFTLLSLDKPVGSLISDVSEATRVETTVSRMDYLFTEFRVIVTYIRLLFLPIGQNLDYDYPIYRSFFDSRVFLSLLVLTSIISFGIYILCRYRRSAPHIKLISFGIFWFFIALSIESSIIPIVDVIFEH
ncbi:MAG TPA: hypothetical protein DCP92_13465 [Nitrospiraceae bacterium]|nr:hypothetical protein [Nitrospiraceae bacterium]